MLNLNRIISGLAGAMLLVLAGCGGTAEPAEDVVGYKLYHGRASGQYLYALDVGLTWMIVGAVYGFALRARNRDEIRAAI